MAHFEVGKKVIAIGNHSKKKFKRGDVFPLIGIAQGMCKHSPVLLDIGIPHDGVGTSYCVVCYAQSPLQNNILFCSSIFAPYDDSLSELTAEDILNEQTVSI